MKKAITYANTRNKIMKKLETNITYLIVKKYCLMDETKITIEEIYENVSEKDINELKKIVDNFNRKENESKNYSFQITTWYYLYKLTDFEVKYMPK